MSESNRTNLRITKPNIEAVEFRIDRFADLPSRKGVDSVDSPDFSCFGHRWCLRVWPGGQYSSTPGFEGSNDGYVAVGVFLLHESDESIELQCTLIVEESPAVRKWASILYYGPLGNHGWLHHNFAERTVLLGALEQGSLTIKAEIREPDCSSGSHPFVPENPLVKNMMKMFNDEEYADMVFEVSCDRDEESSEPSDNRTKMAPTKFYAHRLVLKDGAPILFNLSGVGNARITDVDPAIFECLLLHVYGGKAKDEDLKKNAQAIIDAADKYGAIYLKLEAEASLVSTTDFTIDNVKDLLLYADERNCALLKEAAMDFLVKNKDEVLENVTFGGLVLGDLMTDLLAAFEMKEDMRVSALRKTLHEKGLDVDGSREAMIARLRESS